MTATSKIIVATILLVAGFAAARFMGEPASRWYASSAGSNVPPPVTMPAVLPSNPELPAAPLLNQNARLVPDYEAVNPYQSRDKEQPAAPSLAQHQSDFSNWQGIVASSAATSNETAPAVRAAPSSEPPPRASLRDEAPRPLMVNEPLPALPYALSEPPPLAPVPAGDLAASLPMNTASPFASGSAVAPAEFVQTASLPTTINASYATPAAPPPWPAELQGPRTHIVVDGDSLERLAARYLDDPRRAHEIYEANREKLVDPELLPIGAELLMPESGPRSAFESTHPQSSLAHDPAVRAAVYSGMVRLPSVASMGDTLPRAQLLSPLPAE